MSDILMVLNNYTQALKERNALQAQLEQVTKERDLAVIHCKAKQDVADEILARLAAAEAVCELLASSYLVLPGQLDRDLLKKWKELKEKQ